MSNPAPRNTQVTNFEFYPPATKTPAGFVAAPIYQDEKLIGILAIRIPNQQINNLVNDRLQGKDTDFGKTEETYLVAWDRLMRSQSRFWTEAKKEYKQDVDILPILKLRDSYQSRKTLGGYALHRQ